MKEMRTIVSPPSGFANRVMERVQTYKLKRARRRTLITIGLFVLAMVGLLALLGIQLVSQFEEFTTLPSQALRLVIIVAALAEQAFTTLPSQALQLVMIVAAIAEQAFTLFDALWLSVTIIASSINSAFFVAYACGVVALTALWLRVAVGPFQYPLMKNLRRIEQ